MRPAHLILLSALSVFLFGCGQQELCVDPLDEDGVSWRSILAAAVDLDFGALLGESRLFSSSLGNGDAVLTSESFQSYGDLDHGSFLDVRDVPGGIEATLAEVEGAGAITWIWSANPVGELVLQVDGVEHVYSFRSFLMGKWLPVPYPFAAKTAEGYNLHFPIVHTKNCRIAVRAKSRAELGALFYQVAWNAIGTEKTVDPFDPETIRKHKVEMKQLAQRLLHSRRLAVEEVFSGELAAGGGYDVLSLSGEGEIQCIQILARSKRHLSKLYFEAFWDGIETPSISCPLPMLCGVSDKFEDVQSVPVTVKDAAATIRWPMPFLDGARIRLKNMNDADAGIRVAVEVKSKKSTGYRFNGCYSKHQDLQTDAPNILDLAEIDGAGKIVGYILQVQNRSNGWWGEGDSLIWLDSNDRPVWRGTGTEDYFGFAWCSQTEFEHPFRGQTRASPSNASLYRYHLLDALPFTGQARFQFEAHGIAAGLMDQSALVLWYSESRCTNAWNELR
jgi:hypothetical protein